MRFDVRRATPVLVICCILTVAVTLRIVHYRSVQDSPFHEGSPFLFDAKYYDSAARRIIAGQGLSDEVYFLAPLYPYVLAFNYRVLGGLTPETAASGQVSSPEIHIAAYAQCVWGGVLCVLLYFLARRLAGRAAGAIAGVTAALYGVFISQDGLLMATQTITTVNVLALLALLQARRSSRYGWWFVGGALLGVCILAQPVASLLLPGIVIWILVTPGADNRRAKIIRSVIVCVAAAVCVVPVTARNYIVGHEWVGISSNSGLVFYIGNGPEATGSFQSLPPELRKTPGVTLGWHVRALTEDSAAYSARQVSQMLWRRGRSHIGDHPVRWMGLLWKKFRLFWNAVEIGTNDQYYFYAQHSAVLRQPTIAFGWIAPLGLTGLLFSLRRRPDWMLIHLWLGCQVIAYVSFFVVSRYRLVAVACLIVLGSAALAWWIDLLRRRRFLAGALALVPLAVFTGFVHTPVEGFDRTRGWGRQYQLIASRQMLAGRNTEAAASATAALRHDFRPWSRARGEFYSYKVLALALERSNRYDDASNAAQEALRRVDFLEDRDAAAAERISMEHLLRRIGSARRNLARP